MHLGDACDCGKAVVKAASPASTASFAGNYILARVVGFSYEASWLFAVVLRILGCNAGLWGLGGVWGGGLQVRKQPQLEALALGSWIEKEGGGRGRRKIKDELVNPWPCFTTCCLLLYIVLLFPYQHVRASERL